MLMSVICIKTQRSEKMNAKEYLQQYRSIDERVHILQAEVEKLRADAESMSINLDGMPRGSGTNDKTARLAVLLAECETALQNELSKLWSLRLEIVATIGELREPKYQAILYARYIEGKTWEVIAYEMDITWRYCYMLHGYALEKLNKIINKF